MAASMTALLLAARRRRSSTSFSEIAPGSMITLALSLASFQPRPFVASRAQQLGGGGVRRTTELRLLSNATRDALSSAAASGEWQVALKLMEEAAAAEDAGERPDRDAYNSAVTACSRAGRWRECVELLGAMRAAAATTPTAYAYNNAIAGCSRAGEYAQALALLDEMLAAGVAADTISFNAALNAARHAGDWESATQLLQRMRDRGVAADGRSYSAAIAACRAGGRGAQAARLVGEMVERGAADADADDGAATQLTIAVSDALEACAREGADASLRHAPTLWAHLDGGALAAAGGRAQTRAHTAYIRALGAGGRWEEAVELLGALEAAGGGGGGGGGGGADAVAYNVAIHACARGGAKEACQSLLARMRAAGHAPDAYTFASLLHATRRARRARSAEAAAAAGADADALAEIVGALNEGDASEVNEALDEMEASGAPPAVAAYGAAVDALRRAGDWEASVAILKRMRAAGVQPDGGCYDAALAACHRAGAWAAVRDLLFEMRGSGAVAPESFTHFQKRLWKQAKRELGLAEPASRKPKWEPKVFAGRGGGRGRGRGRGRK